MPPTTAALPEFFPAGCYCPTCRTAALQKSKALSFYPNPAGDHITIDNAEKGESISIWDIMGNLVLNIQAKYSTFDVDLTKLPSGVYIVDVNGIKSGKLIKLQ